MREARVGPDAAAVDVETPPSFAAAQPITTTSVAKRPKPPARADRSADEGDENSEGDDRGRDKGDGDARGHEGQAPEGKQRPPDRSPLPRCANGADGPC